MKFERIVNFHIDESAQSTHFPIKPGEVFSIDGEQAKGQVDVIHETGSLNIITTEVIQDKGGKYDVKTKRITDFLEKK